MPDENRDVQIKSLVQKFILEANRACHWCSKNSDKREDGFHVHKTIVVDKCKILAFALLLRLAKKAIRECGNLNARR